MCTACMTNGSELVPDGTDFRFHLNGERVELNVSERGRLDPTALWEQLPSAGASDVLTVSVHRGEAVLYELDLDREPQA